MYYDDEHLHPSHKNEYDNNSHNNKDAIQNIKLMDKGYFKYQRKMNKLWVDGKYYNNVSIEYYASADTGNKIRNAITGYRTNFKVGSPHEDLFFKVKIVNGNSKPYSGHLYYDSPEQYEKHQFTQVDSKLKEQWYKRQTSPVTTV